MISKTTHQFYGVLIMAENLMNSSHIATSEAYRENYDRIFGKKSKVRFNKKCPYFCDFGGKEEWVYCQVVHSYIKECHPDCLER